VRFLETGLSGAFLIDPDCHRDERGLFARTFCEREFAEHGLPRDFVQCSTSWSRSAGTIRGMHWQRAPHAEGKLVRCTRGAIFDVIVDLRPGSRTRLGWFGLELSAESRRMLYVPEGFAHGFQTLRDCSEVCYQMTAFFEPRAARGFRYDDPGVGILWPLPPSVVSKRDRELPTVGAGCPDG
jgi:dTDP-4-dehydrorhamnose 3,5-epimerase